VGTDAYIRHKDGTISLVQVKYRSKPNATMYREYISNATLEAKPLSDKIVTRKKSKVIPN
jgi:hypothetical protein